MNSGMGFLQKDHSRKSRATLDEVMFHAPDGVKACLGQRFIQYPHDPISITQEAGGHPCHVGDQMVSKDFSSRFYKFWHPIVHITFRE